MGLNYSKNLMWANLPTDDQMRDIPYPYEELHWDNILKGLEIGSVIGLAVGPCVAIASRNPGLMTKYTSKSMKVFAGIGLVGAPIYTEFKLNSCCACEHQIENCCYHRRYDRNQVRIDRCSVYNGIGLAALASMFKVNIFSGLLYGISSGTIIGEIYNKYVFDPQIRCKYKCVNRRECDTPECQQAKEGRCLSPWPKPFKPEDEEPPCKGVERKKRKKIPQCE